MRELSEVYELESWEWRYQILCGRDIAQKDRFATQMANYCYLVGPKGMDLSTRIGGEHA